VYVSEVMFLNLKNLRDYNILIEIFKDFF
jgi:hypothetical protein